MTGPDPSPALSPDQALLAALDHHLSGRTAEAAELYARILAVVPDHANALHLSGVLAAQTGDAAGGVARIARAVALAPDVADYHGNLAKLFRAQGRTGPAAACLRRLLALHPDALEEAATLGVLEQEAGHPTAAAAAFRRALALQPDLAEITLRLATLLPPDAVPAMVRRAARLNPLDRRAWSVLGAAHRALGRHEDALAAFEAALALDPADVAALGTHANATKDLRRLDESLAAHDRADRLSGGDPTIRWNRAHALLLAGRLEEGFAAHEARWLARGFPTAPRGLPQPLWHGEDIAGRTILLYEEQGRGDVIQFVRYAPLVASRGARVVLEVGADLVELVRSVPGVDAVVARGEPLPPMDVQCPLLSLPHVFGTTLASVPATVPYLSADPARVAAWRGRLVGGDSKGELKVGLVWAGNPAFATDRERSPGLAALLPLLEVPGVRFYGLQLGPGRDALAERAMPPAFTDLAPHIADFTDTAAIMDNLDLVISSCTAPAHLAGALGRPVWGLLSFAADWRWLADRADSPWYPTARLFRQPRPGDWAAVAAAVRAALEETVRGTALSAPA